MVCGSNGDGQNSARPTTQEPAQAIQPTAAPSVPAAVTELISEVMENEKSQVRERAYPPGITNRR